MRVTCPKALALMCRASTQALVVPQLPTTSAQQTAQLPSLPPRPHVVSTSKTSTLAWLASARPLSVMMVGGAMPRWMHTSCTADTTADRGVVGWKGDS